MIDAVPVSIEFQWEKEGGGDRITQVGDGLNANENLKDHEGLILEPQSTVFASETGAGLFSATPPVSVSQQLLSSPVHPFARRT